MSITLPLSGDPARRGAAWPAWLDDLRRNTLKYSEFYNRLWLPE